MTPQDKAERAKRLLEDDVFQAVMADMRNRVVSKMEAVAITDRDIQHELVLTLQLLQKLPAMFQEYVSEYAVQTHKESQTASVEKLRQRYRA